MNLDLAANPSRFIDLIVVVFMLLWVAVLNYLRRSKPENPLLELLVEVLAVGYSGGMMLIFCEWQGIEQSLAFFLIGAAAYLGPRTLFTFANRFLPGLFPQKDKDQ